MSTTRTDAQPAPHPPQPRPNRRCRSLSTLMLGRVYPRDRERHVPDRRVQADFANHVARGREEGCGGSEGAGDG